VLTDGAEQRFSNEARLTGQAGALSWMVGGLVEDLQSRLDRAEIDTDADGNARLVADRVTLVSTRRLAGFGELGWAAGRWAAQAGLRYQDLDQQLTASDNRAGCAASGGCFSGSLSAADGSAIPVRRSSGDWLPRFELTFRASDALQLFAHAERSVESGGWEVRATRPDALLPFDEASEWQLSAGVKAGFLDGRLRGELAGFWHEAGTVQVEAADIVGDAVRYATLSSVGLRARGVEARLWTAPLDGLRIDLAARFEDADYRVADGSQPGANGQKSVRQQQADCVAQLAAGRIALAPTAQNAPDCAVGIVTADGGIAQPVNRPSLRLGLSVRYEVAVPMAGIMIGPTLDVAWRSQMETQSANATIFEGPSGPAFDGTQFPANAQSGDIVTGSKAQAALLTGAALVMRTDDDNWQLRLSCSNCLDSNAQEGEYLRHGYKVQPRTWLVSARRQF
jgi:iron complex outermembrane receptor protein